MIDKKLNNKGLTLFELLITIVILLLISAMMVTGITLAVNSHSQTMTANNSDVLLSTTVSALRNTLAEATEVSASGKTLNYRNAYTNASASISAGSNGIELTESGTTKKLLPEAAATRGLYTTYDSVSATDTIITFVNLRVVKDDKTYASIEEFNIRYN